jgi:hypothetical protein
LTISSLFEKNKDDASRFGFPKKKISENFLEADVAASLEVLLLALADGESTSDRMLDE